MSVPQTLGELLSTSVERHGGREAVVAAGERLTYEALASRSDRYAKALVAAGCGKGTRVGLLMENSADWVALLFAATGIGAILVPVSTFSKSAELAHQLRLSDVSVLVTVGEFLGNDYVAALESALGGASTEGRLFNAQLPALRRVVVHGTPAWREFLEAGESVPDSVLRGLQLEVDPEDACYLLFTSGTTSLPKAVLHVHRAVAGNGARIGDFQGLAPDDVVWTPFPLFFSAGCCNVALGTLSHGARLVLAARFEAGSALALIENEKVTTWHLWPHNLKALLGHPDWKLRDHSLLHKGTGPYDILLGAEPADGLGGVNMYGLTETCTAFACTDAAESAVVRMGTQGRPLPGNEVVVVDTETGERLVDAGLAGEICVKGPAVMRRYYKVDPAETFDAEGFFHTGDLGFIDADGRVHFEHRIKDVIKTGGMNVAAAEVEAVLARAPGVDAAYVFALPDPDRGEVVGAAVVGAGVDVAAVREHCAASLASYKRPARLLVVTSDEVPMTGSGKVQKHLLAAMLAAAE